MCLFLERHRVGTIKGIAHSLQLKTKFHISTLIRAMHDMNSSRSDIGDTNRASDRLSVSATFTTFDSRICNKILPERILFVSAFGERTPFVAAETTVWETRRASSLISEEECVARNLDANLRRWSLQLRDSSGHSELRVLLSLPFVVSFIPIDVFVDIFMLMNILWIMLRSPGEYMFECAQQAKRAMTPKRTKMRNTNWLNTKVTCDWVWKNFYVFFVFAFLETSCRERSNTQQISIECGVRALALPRNVLRSLDGGKCVKERTSFEFVSVSDAIKNRWSDNEPN